MKARRVVAIIDDDPIVRTAIAMLLSSAGYGTETYESAENFIMDVDRSEAACLVVDVHLGDISGIEMAHHLDALGYTFPIVFVTGSSEQTFQRQAMEMGCIAYLLKPITAERLLAAVLEGIGQPER